jgi:hypothetical protein
MTTEETQQVIDETQQFSPGHSPLGEPPASTEDEEGTSCDAALQEFYGFMRPEDAGVVDYAEKVFLIEKALREGKRCLFDFSISEKVPPSTDLHPETRHVLTGILHIGENKFSMGVNLDQCTTLRGDASVAASATSSVAVAVAVDPGAVDLDEVQLQRHQAVDEIFRVNEEAAEDASGRVAAVCHKCGVLADACACDRHAAAWEARWTRGSGVFADPRAFAERTLGLPMASGVVAGSGGAASSSGVVAGLRRSGPIDTDSPDEEHVSAGSRIKKLRKFAQQRLDAKDQDDKDHEIRALP